MAKLYYKAVPETAGCDGCVADGSKFLCDKLKDALIEKYGIGCYDKKVIFKFIKREGK